MVTGLMGEAAVEVSGSGLLLGVVCNDNSRPMGVTGLNC